MRLERARTVWQLVQCWPQARTDQDGRCSQLLPDENALSAGLLPSGVRHATVISRRRKSTGLYPVVEVTFQVRDGESHFHIPLLLSPNGYTTYRGT